MKPYIVWIINTRGGVEELGRYEDKGQARRAWSTATRGACIAKDGAVLEHKSGTSKVVAAQLARHAEQAQRVGPQQILVDPQALPKPAPVVEVEDVEPVGPDSFGGSDFPDPFPVEPPPAAPPPPVVVHEPVKASLSIARAEVIVETPDEPAPVKCAVKDCNELVGAARRDTPEWAVGCCQRHRVSGGQMISKGRTTAAGVVAYLSEGPHVRGGAAVRRAPASIGRCALDGCNEPAARSHGDTHPNMQGLCTVDRKRARDAIHQGRTTVENVIGYLNEGVHPKGRHATKPSQSPKLVRKRAETSTKAPRAPKPSQSPSGDPLAIVRRFAAVVHGLGGIDSAERLALVVARVGGVGSLESLVDEVLSLGGTAA